MNQHVDEQPVPGRSFFQSQSFWLGSALWLAVAMAAFVMWKQKPDDKSGTAQVGAIASSEQSAEASNSEPDEPRQMTLTTYKDGNTQIKLPGEDPESPWDKDGIADFSFINTDGKAVTKADLLGKPWIVCFVFTHCALTCPRVTQSMRELQDQLKDYDFRLVSITVDPERDTPEVLKEYGKSRGADFSKWSFLGGDQREIYRLIKGSFKMPVVELLGEKRKTGFEFIHSNNIMLVDENGVVRGKFDATKGPAMAELRREIQKIAKSTKDTAVSEPAKE